jgi:two-component system response regulator AtoC
VAVSQAASAVAELESAAFDVVLADGKLAPEVGAALKRLGLDGTTTLAPLVRPWRTEEVLLAVETAGERAQMRRENQALRTALAGRQVAAPSIGIIAATSGAMENVLRTVRKIAEYKTTVLITGESGTGKELVARAIHNQSPRESGPFVAVNCGAIPESLIESELFGHKKGSFTDAIRDKRGLFAEASGGTLFLDEIGELPLGPQVKLLRVLQEQMVRAVGDVVDEKVDVRVVAATVRDLAAEVKAGRFREDLFYRLNVIQVALPPLRERREDIPLLVDHFVRRTNGRLGTSIEGVSAEAMKRLLDYGWPGNVRELENTIERAMVLADGQRIELEGLPEKLRAGQDRIREALHSGELSIKKTTRIIEEELIRRALQKTQGNRTNASKLLEISHRALLYKIKEFGIDDL